MKKTFIILIISILSNTINAQQATQIDPKYIALPRFADLTAIQAAITSPVNGMMVYNNATQSFWYYNGTWSNLSVAASGNQWTTSGTNIYNTNTGNVGLGVSNPVEPIETKGRILLRSLTTNESAGIILNNLTNTTRNVFIGTDQTNNLGFHSYGRNASVMSLNLSSGGLRIEGPTTANSGNNSLSLGGFGKMSVDAPGVLGGRFTILDNGNVGIGTNAPTHKLNVVGSARIEGGGNLSFKNTSTFGGTASIAYSNDGYLILNPDYTVDGAGVWLNPLNVLTGTKFKNNGEISLNNNSGTLNQVLTSGGSGGAATWKSTSQLIQNFSISAPSFTIPNNQTNNIPNSSITFTTTTGGRLIVFPRIETTFNCANPLDHCLLSWDFTPKVDGSTIVFTTSGITRFQQAIAYITVLEERSLGPYTVTLAPGTHTISFDIKLNTIAPPPAVILSAFAQFIPN